MRQDEQGRWVSDDGQWMWDGDAWQRQDASGGLTGSAASPDLDATQIHAPVGDAEETRILSETADTDAEAGSRAGGLGREGLSGGVGGYGSGPEVRRPGGDETVAWQPDFSDADDPSRTQVRQAPAFGGAAGAGYGAAGGAAEARYAPPAAGDSEYGAAQGAGGAGYALGPRGQGGPSAYSPGGQGAPGYGAPGYGSAAHGAGGYETAAYGGAPGAAYAGPGYGPAGAQPGQAPPGSVPAPAPYGAHAGPAGASSHYAGPWPPLGAAPADRRGRGRPSWLIPLIVALIVIGIAVGVFFLLQGDNSTSSTSSPAQASPASTAPGLAPSLPASPGSTALSPGSPALPGKLTTDSEQTFMTACQAGATQAYCACVLTALENQLTPDEFATLDQQVHNGDPTALARLEVYESGCRGVLPGG